jgi:hypothetical protein
MRRRDVERKVVVPQEQLPVDTAARKRKVIAKPSVKINEPSAQGELRDQLDLLDPH